MQSLGDSEICNHYPTHTIDRTLELQELCPNRLPIKRYLFGLIYLFVFHKVVIKKFPVIRILSVLIEYVAF